MRERKRLAAALAAVQLYLEEEARAKAPWRPPSLWRISGRREQMMARAAPQARGPHQG